MGETTITVSEETKQRLDNDRSDGQTWDTYLNELLDRDSDAPSDGGGAGTDAIAEQLDGLEERLDRVEERVEHVPDRVVDAFERVRR